MLIRTMLFFPLALALGLLSGCKSETDKPAAPVKDGAHADHDHDHDHGHHHEPGPHDGEVFPLGKDDYHVELVETSDDILTVYILDHEVEQEVPVSEDAVSLNIMIDGAPQQFALTAVQPKNGMASQFTLEDAAAAQGVHTEGSKAKLTVDIAGKQYVADLDHHHDHDHDHGDEEHDHDHGDEEHGDEHDHESDQS